ncbi:MAG: tetratricopeptide repeat protein [Bacteroidetes bacterium]|nr:tetratricopeptide repeat protein [Bacteroidota bacterium]
MKNAALGFCLFLIAVVFVSCSGREEKKEKTVAGDSLKSDYLKSVSRDSKSYLNDCKKLFSEARHMDSIVMQETEMKTELANKAIKAFTDYSYYCTNDSVAPVFLIKAAQISQSINNVPQAKFILDKCIEDHPDFKNIPAALFILAQLYDDENSYLNSEVEAQKLYKRIIDEYPKSDLVPSAKGALMQIGKTDKQMMEEFTKKKK